MLHSNHAWNSLFINSKIRQGVKNKLHLPAIITIKYLHQILVALAVMVSEI